MTFDQESRRHVLGENAVAYSRVGMENILREFPHMPWFVATAPGPIPTHRELHPAFFGSFDWHSCVEMHWVLVTLLREFPEHALAPDVRDVLNDLLTPGNLQTELAFFSNPATASFERPYGWGWLLTLASTLHGWDDPDGRAWFGAIRPLADLLAEKFSIWLPKQAHPVRSGMHNNTAFGLLRSLDYAGILADGGNDALLDAIYAAAHRLFLGDTAYPAHYEPSGADFLSAALSEAELLSCLMDELVFPEWLEGFLPGLAACEPAAIFTPVVSTDPADGQNAHLVGLNLSRAASFLAIAGALPEDDPRRAALISGAEDHAAASLDQVVGGEYMTEHWLAAYATLLLLA
jgi:hypothetical protein